MKKLTAITLAALMMSSLVPGKSVKAYISDNDYNDNYNPYYHDYDYNLSTVVVNVVDYNGNRVEGAFLTLTDDYGQTIYQNGGDVFSVRPGRYTVNVSYGNNTSYQTIYVTDGYNYETVRVDSNSGLSKDSFRVRVVDRDGYDISNADVRIYDDNNREVSSVGPYYTIDPFRTYEVRVLRYGRVIYRNSFTSSDIYAGELRVSAYDSLRSYGTPKALSETLKLADDLERCGDFSSVEKSIRDEFKSRKRVVENIADDFKDGKFNYYGYGDYRYDGDYYVVDGYRYTYNEFYKKFGFYPDYVGAFTRNNGYYRNDDDYRWYLDKYNGLSMRYYVERLVDSMNDVKADLPISTLCFRDYGQFKYPYTRDYNGFDTVGSYDDKAIKEANSLVDEAQKLRDKRNDSAWKKYQDKLDKEIKNVKNAIAGKSSLTEAVKSLKSAIKEAKENDGKVYIRRSYMKGLNGEIFSPNGNLTRAEMAQIISNLLEQSGKTINYNQMSFKDVSTNAWYYNAVKNASSYGIMVGTPDGNFNPQKAVSKEELIVIAARLGGHDKVMGNSLNIINHKWSVPYIERALLDGWITGQNFNPSDAITRGETAHIINNAIGFGVDREYIDANADKMITFNDVLRANPFYYDILVATNTISYQRTENLRIWRANIRPDGSWTDSSWNNGNYLAPIK